ncbi:carboxymuconolactone decarboxylase family protein [Phenylobacterium sp. LjRoot219]|uniref:carboxymuconolactone decarboxylase family protein n=1 Tax=Phenylobacterium sp. LjRoot219 TaxID=3342283 RepID=UPI003ECC8399
MMDSVGVVHTDALKFDIAAREAQVVGEGPRIEPLELDAIASHGDRPLLELGKSFGRSAEQPYVPEAVATMMRDPGLFRCQLALSIQLAGSGAISPRERELAVLRVTWLCRAPYAWGEHVANAKHLGMTAEEIERVTQGSSAAGWSDHERAVLRAVEELLGDQSICDETWDALARTWDQEELIELPVLVGAYFTFALQHNSFKVRLSPNNQGLRQR